MPGVSVETTILRRSSKPTTNKILLRWRRKNHQGLDVLKSCVTAKHVSTNGHLKKKTLRLLFSALVE